MVKERPIIFSGPMVRAILACRKTQTRRAVKIPARAWDCGPEIPSNVEGWAEYDRGWCGWGHGSAQPGMQSPETPFIACPYGQPGDRLWVRETHVVESNREVDSCDVYPPPYDDDRPIRWTDDPDWGRYWQQCHYRATDPKPELAYDDTAEPACRWRPSIHMSRWASRIALEVVKVRVERLQSISEQDARAEGCPVSRTGLWKPRGWFGTTWGRLNAKRGHGWDTDPWVWVVEFAQTERASS